MQDFVRQENVELLKSLCRAQDGNRPEIGNTYCGSSTSLGKSGTPQLAPSFVEMLCGLFGAILVAVQVADCDVGFLTGVEG